MIDIFGTDIKSDFSFTDGDLDLVSSTDNLGQAIINRLNTDLGFYDWCYTYYGSNLSTVYGLKNNDNVLEYIRVEIEATLRQDPRIKEIICNCRKGDPQTVCVELDILTINSNEMVTINLVINEDNIVKINEEAK